MTPDPLKMTCTAANVYATEEGRGIIKVPGCNDGFSYAFSDRPIETEEVIMHMCELEIA